MRFFLHVRHLNITIVLLLLRHLLLAKWTSALSVSLCFCTYFYTILYSLHTCLSTCIHWSVNSCELFLCYSQTCQRSVDQGQVYWGYTANVLHWLFDSTVFAAVINWWATSITNPSSSTICFKWKIKILT